jgi:SAM-dependent methyltransferase
MTICRNPKNCMALPSAWVLRFIDELPPHAKVLDVACGEGRHTSLCLLRGFDVTAVDADVTHLEPLVGTPGLTLECRDLEAEPWPYAEEAFDAIIVTNYLYRAHFPHYWRSLKPGGLFLMETFTTVNTAIWGRPRSPEHVLQPGELLRLAPPEARICAYEEGLNADELGLERIVWLKPGDAEVLALRLGAR